MDGYEEAIADLSVSLGVSERCAADVIYLRSRHRWTEELEAELIALHWAGTPPEEIGTFGVTPETQQRLLDAVLREVGPSQRD